MAWHTPLAYSDTTVYDEDDFNEQLGENLTFLYDVPSCFVYLNANQSVANNTAHDVVYSVEDGDTQGMHDNVSGRERITITVPGRYFYGASLGFQAAAGLRRLSIQDQGGSVRARREVPNASGYLDSWLNCASFHTFTATNWIKSVAHQISGGPLNAMEDSSFWVHWVGAT